MELYFNGRNLLIIVGYYLIINLILYFTMVIDKKRAIKDIDFILTFTVTAILHMVVAFLLIGKFAFVTK